jgi:hypothetical protein
MSKETDWDAPDDDGVIDFDEIEDLSIIKPKKEVKAVVQTPPRRAEPPPVSTTPKQEKVIENAAKAAQKLSQELETLDYHLDKFIKFEKKVSSFKIKNTLAIGATALFLGGYIGSIAQSELNSYYVKQEVLHKLKGSAEKLTTIKKFEDAGFNFVENDDVLQVYSKAPKVQLYESQGFKILQINKKTGEIK